MFEVLEWGETAGVFETREVAIAYMSGIYQGYLDDKRKFPDMYEGFSFDDLVLMQRVEYTPEEVMKGTIA